MNKILIESHQFIKFGHVFVLITYKSAYTGNAWVYPPQSDLDYCRVSCFFISYLNICTDIPQSTIYKARISIQLHNKSDLVFFT